MFSNRTEADINEIVMIERNNWSYNGYKVDLAFAITGKRKNLGVACYSRPVRNYRDLKLFKALFTVLWVGGWIVIEALPCQLSFFLSLLKKFVLMLPLLYIIIALILFCMLTIYWDLLGLFIEKSAFYIFLKFTIHIYIFANIFKFIP